MSQEIELKLEVATASVAALLESGLLGENGTETELNATYFDTQNHELRRHGHSLRIRNSSGKAMQTVKAGDDGAGLFARGEWELPVVGQRPVADMRTPVSDLLATRLDELLPQFDVATKRHKHVLRESGAEIEIAVDTVEVSVGGRATRFCEVELELLQGEPGPLFALARRIDGIAPVRISAASKSGRGYELLGPLPVSFRSATPALVPAMDLTSAFATIAADCLRQYRLNEAILLERHIPEAVHQARIALRRLRSAMALFKYQVVGPDRDRLNEQIADLARCLGEARDLDVLSAKAKPGPVLERLSHARDAAHAAMQRRLKAKATRMLMLDLSEWIACGSWRNDQDGGSLQSFAAAQLDRLRRKVAKHGKHLAQLEPDARHRLRKHAKKLRYASEFLTSLFEGRDKKFRKALEALQDDLGALNDRATAEERLASLGLVGTAEVDAFLAQWPTDDLLDKAAGRHKALLGVKPFWR